MKVYLFEATGISKATQLATKMRFEARLAEGDVFDNEELNSELARTIAESDARTYLSPEEESGVIEVLFLGTREDDEHPS